MPVELVVDIMVTIDTVNPRPRRAHVACVVRLEYLVKVMRFFSYALEVLLLVAVLLSRPLSLWFVPPVAIAGDKVEVTE